MKNISLSLLFIFFAHLCTQAPAANEDVPYAKFNVFRDSVSLSGDSAARSSLDELAALLNKLSKIDTRKIPAEKECVALTNSLHSSIDQSGIIVALFILGDSVKLPYSSCAPQAALRPLLTYQYSIDELPLLIELYEYVASMGISAPPTPRTTTTPEIALDRASEIIKDLLGYQGNVELVVVGPSQNSSAWLRSVLYEVYLSTDDVKKKRAISNSFVILDGSPDCFYK